MDLYTVTMMSGTSVAAHISLFYASMVAHAQDPFSEFHSIILRVCRVLWSLCTVDMWVEFRLHCHDFMMKGNPSWDGPRF